MEAFSILPDPQTNGPLLIAANPDSANEVIEIFKNNGLERYSTPVGKLIARDEKIIQVKR